MAQTYGSNTRYEPTQRSARRTGGCRVRPCARLDRPPTVGRHHDHQRLRCVRLLLPRHRLPEGVPVDQQRSFDVEPRRVRRRCQWSARQARRRSAARTLRSLPSQAHTCGPTERGERPPRRRV